jgi:hypothetical protein
MLAHLVRLQKEFTRIAQFKFKLKLKLKLSLITAHMHVHVFVLMPMVSTRIIREDRGNGEEAGADTGTMIVFISLNVF